MDNAHVNCYPVEGELGGQRNEEEASAGTAPEEEKTAMEEIAATYEQVKQQVETRFDMESRQRDRRIPVLKAPALFTKEHWEQHEATHTPFQLWCKHCKVVRAVRRPHPSKGRRFMVVFDVERGIDMFVEFSIGYMHFREIK